MYLFMGYIKIVKGDNFYIILYIFFHYIINMKINSELCMNTNYSKVNNQYEMDVGSAVFFNHSELLILG